MTLEVSRLNASPRTVTVNAQDPPAVQSLNLHPLPIRPFNLAATTTCPSSLVRRHSSPFDKGEARMVQGAFPRCLGPVAATTKMSESVHALPVCELSWPAERDRDRERENEGEVDAVSDAVSSLFLSTANNQLAPITLSPYTVSDDESLDTVPERLIDSPVEHLHTSSMTLSPNSPDLPLFTSPPSVPSRPYPDVVIVLSSDSEEADCNDPAWGDAAMLVWDGDVNGSSDGEGKNSGHGEAGPAISDSEEDSWGTWDQDACLHWDADGDVGVREEEEEEDEENEEEDEDEGDDEEEAGGMGGYDEELEHSNPQDDADADTPSQIPDYASWDTARLQVSLDCHDPELTTIAFGQGVWIPPQHSARYTGQDCQRVLDGAAPFIRAPACGYFQGGRDEKGSRYGQGVGCQTTKARSNTQQASNAYSKKR